VINADTTFGTLQDSLSFPDSPFAVSADGLLTVVLKSGKVVTVNRGEKIASVVGNMHRSRVVMLTSPCPVRTTSFSSSYHPTAVEVITVLNQLRMQYPDCENFSLLLVKARDMHPTWLLNSKRCARLMTAKLVSIS
jgi:hypothetical protein